MKARNIMRPAPWVVDRIDSLGEAYDLMRAHAIRHLPVVHDGRLEGMLAERDILEYRTSLGFDQEWRDYGVSGAMSRSPRTGAPDDSIPALAERLSRDKFDALPIVEDGALVGIITVADLLAAPVGGDAAAARRPRSTVAQMMTPGPFTARPEDSLLDAAKRMLVHGIRHLPVVDAGDRVIGMLSELDLRTVIGDPTRFVTDGRSVLTVRDAMNTAPGAVVQDRPIVDIARLFEDGRTEALPVVDRANRLVGIISYVDALHAFTADRANA